MIPTAQSDCPLLTADFDYPLPAALIADRPTPVRSACRLLTLDSEKEAISHTIFGDLLNLLNPGDLLVLNNTQVIPARLLGHKVSGGRVEVLVERLLGQQQALVHIRASKAPKPGTQLILGNAQGQDNITTTVMARQDRLFLLQFNDPRPLLTLLEAIGQVPLPPYIHRPAQASDRTQYQTVYASVPGAVAAPTAGLHFDQLLLDALQAKGVESAYVTLHVGAGTFQPVQVTQIKDHLMHAEYVHVPAEVVNAVLACKARGKRVVAVGTSAVRALESAAQAAMPLPIAPFSGDTRLFIYPGYRYQIVDALITNFHLPCSTLLMLVSAFAGYSLVLKAYHEAITQRYRFFSYGDAMLITRGYRPTGLNQP